VERRRVAAGNRATGVLSAMLFAPGSTGFNPRRGLHLTHEHEGGQRRTPRPRTRGRENQELVGGPRNCVAFGGTREDEVDPHVGAERLRMRAAGFSTHELSLVNGSSTTLARWKVVTHSSSGRDSPPIVVRVMSSATVPATVAKPRPPTPRYVNAVGL
jgi:hypothetical protein